ncbi:MAG: 2-phosphosulfolactate phosphatase [Melioribacteraceae bacterium]|nr:2-phosphosulfolactate phosphatase [Melioribacteraceae bacterium]
MKAHVLLSPHNVDELYFTGKNTVVIDVLRATTVINTALIYGAKEIIPVNTIEFAMKVSGNAFGGQTILAGERNTKKIDGFTLGNSPLDFTKENVEGKSIILFTTNGSKAIVKAKFSENLFLCSFNNLDAVAEHLVKMNEDFEILCAGSNGMFCIEDTVCAGKLVRKIQKLKNEIVLTDAAKASLELNKSFGKNVEELLKDCEHGQKLIANGFEEDIRYCAQIDTLNSFGVYESGSIKLHKNK